MIAVTRFRVPLDDAAHFTERAHRLLSALRGSPGFKSGRLGRTVDDPTLWAMITEWDGAGFYRRGLGGYEVRMLAIPLTALAIDEPGAYEVIDPC